MISKYYNLTVAELKELLKERKLPVSGTKKILIQRLEEYDSENSNTVVEKPERKVDLKCGQCSTRLRVPKSYNGNIKCPNCSNVQEISGAELNDHLSLDSIIEKIKNLDRKTVSLGISIIGIIIAFVAIFTFFSAFSYEAMCNEEDRTTVTVDGEEFQGCDGGVLWETKAWDRISNACCILVPLSLILTIIGYTTRKKSGVTTKLEPITGDDGKITISSPMKNKNTTGDKMIEGLQIGFMGFSISLGVITIILGILLLLFIIFVFSIILGAWEATPPFQS